MEVLGDDRDEYGRNSVARVMKTVWVMQERKVRNLGDYRKVRIAKFFFLTYENLMSR